MVEASSRDQAAGPAKPLPPWWRVLRLVAITLSVLLGMAMILLAFTVGRCDAFGGRCPRTPPPLLEDDTFGIAAVGAALVVGVPVFLARPSRRRAGIALAWGAAAAVLVGLMARSGTSF